MSDLEEVIINDTVVSVVDLSDRHDSTFDLKLKGGSLLTVTTTDTQQCCEEYSVSPPSDIMDIVGKKIIKATISCTEEETEDDWADISGTCFITLHTMKGEYVFNLYNTHNGYYSHYMSLAINGKLVLDGGV